MKRPGAEPHFWISGIEQSIRKARVEKQQWSIASIVRESDLHGGDGWLRILEFSADGKTGRKKIMQAREIAMIAEYDAVVCGGGASGFKIPFRY